METALIKIQYSKRRQTGDLLCRLFLAYLVYGAETLGVKIVWILHLVLLIWARGHGAEIYPEGLALTSWHGLTRKIIPFNAITNLRFYRIVQSRESKSLPNFAEYVLAEDHPKRLELRTGNLVRRFSETDCVNLDAFGRILFERINSAPGEPTFEELPQRGRFLADIIFVCACLASYLSLLVLLVAAINHLTGNGTQTTYFYAKFAAICFVGALTSAIAWSRVTKR